MVYLFSDMRSFIRLIRYCRPFWGHAALNMLFNLLSAIFSVFSLLMLIPFLRILFGRETNAAPLPDIAFSLSQLKTWAMQWLDYGFGQLILTKGNTGALAVICGAVLLIFLLKNLFRYLAFYVLAPMRTGVSHQLRGELYDNLLQRPVLYFTDHKKGDLLARFSTDIQEVENGILHFLDVLFKEPVAVLATLITLLIMSPSLTAFVLVLLPLSALLIGRIGKTLKQQSSEAQGILGEMLGTVEETISGAKVIHGYQATGHMKGKFGTLRAQYRNLALRMLRRRDLSSPLSELLGIAVVMLLLWFGGRLVLEGKIGLGPEGFITFIVVFSQMISPAKAMANASYFIQKGMAAFDRVQDFINERQGTANPSQYSDEISFGQEIEFREVSFQYGDRVVLDHLSFRIKKGERIAIVGPSGSGKSTLAGLLMRFWEPSAGHILIDGKPLSGISPEAWRRLTALVSQEPILFHDTILHNLTLGHEHSRENIDKALKLSFSDNFVTQLPMGLQTVIGERGMKLSGGEQQRLCLARALLRQPQLLILDEPTSSLDSHAEQQVKLALEATVQGRTAIIIAHRLSTIKQVDRILVLRDGSLVEEGTPAELLEKQGEYYRMVQWQG
jgi:ATP-binding cassette, subfamily B, bacterial MsbA